jgi:hypothetical protein
MRRMQDAVTPAHIDPAAVDLVAGYINGRYAWTAADWARFPNAVHVEISVFASDTRGHVLDVEPGDATPAESVGWVKARRAAGADPSVYCNLAAWPAVRAAFEGAGVPEPHYWIAHYDGDPAIPAGAVAKQYLGDVAPGIDISSVADHWPGVDPQEADMPFTAQDFNFLMWGNVFDDDGSGHTRNYAQYVKDMGAQLGGLSTALTNVTNLVVNNQANEITADKLAAALQSTLTAQVGPAIRDALAASLTPQEADAIATAVVAKIAAKLGGA